MKKQKAPTSIVVYILRTIFISFKMSIKHTGLFNTGKGSILSEFDKPSKILKEATDCFGNGENLYPIGYFFFYIWIQIVGAMMPIFLLVNFSLLLIPICFQLLGTCLFGFVFILTILVKKFGSFFVKKNK